MIALIQRVTEARVEVEGETVGAIGPGLLALVAVEPGDDEPRIARMAERLLGYRVFADAAGKMNLSLDEVGGGLLLVSQFTLAADTGRACGPASPRRRRRRTAGAASSGWWPCAGSGTQALKPGASAPICR